MTASRRSLPQKTVYRLLADQRRRGVIAILQEQGSLQLEELAMELAHRKHDSRESEIPDEELSRVRASLWHVHIPKLAEANVVSFDRKRKVVTIGEYPDLIDRLLACGSPDNSPTT